LFVQAQLQQFIVVGFTPYKHRQIGACKPTTFDVFSSEILGIKKINSKPHHASRIRQGQSYRLFYDFVCFTRFS
jgi:hypothetical protein